MSRAAAFVRDALGGWDRARGVGITDVATTPGVHPIAEARFLAATAGALENDLIDAREARRMATTATARLATCAIPAGEGLAWGLNFVHPTSGAPATDIDVVTTAWVALGLDAATALGVIGAAALRNKSGVALTLWPDATGAPRLPRMWSMRDEPPVVNAAVLRALALHRLGVAEAIMVEAAVVFASDNRLARRGWDFAPGRRSVDMVHSAYVIQALAVLDSSPDVARGALEMLNALRCGGRFHQKIQGRATAPDDALAEPRSLGEALVACTALAARPDVDALDALLVRIRLLATEALDRFGDPDALRGPDGHLRIKDMAHLAVGLARAMPLLAPA